MKNLIRHMAKIATALIFTFSMTSLYAFSLDQAIVHKDCNQVTETKSPLNNKSLNPLCNLCIKSDDTSNNTTTTYLEFAGSELFLVCNTDTKDLNGLKEDWAMMCGSRGGSVVPNANPNFLVCQIGS